MDRLDDGLMSNGLLSNGPSANANTNETTNNINSTLSTNQKSDASSTSNSNKYTMPSVLHFLQHEWSKYEYDKQQWELEKAELQTKISFLQGERRGQETLKNDLIRRIKMLELALKQERVKYNRLKASMSNDYSSSNVNNLDVTSAQHQQNHNQESNGILDDTQNTAISLGNLLQQFQTSTTHSNTQIKQGRHVLRQYLQEISHADNIIDIRTAKLRSLFDVTSTNTKQNNNLTNNADDDPLKKSILKNPKQLQQLAADQASRPLSSSSSLSFKQQPQTQTTSTSLSSLNVHNTSTNVVDFENEEVLKEFNFLNNEQDINLNESVNERYEEEVVVDNNNEDDDDDDCFIDRNTLTSKIEEYKKERKTKSNKQQASSSSSSSSSSSNLTTNTFIHNNSSGTSTRPSRASLQQMIANLNNSEPIDSNTLGQQQGEQNETMVDEASLNLGELSRINVNDDSLSDTRQADISNVTLTTNTRHTLVNKYTLKGHFDAVRCVAFHPRESLLLSGSEDQTIKLWNLDKFNTNTLQTKKTAQQTSDFEAIHTYRGHTAAVLDLLINADHTKEFYSSSLDSTIKQWNLPDDWSTLDTYDGYNPNLCVQTFRGHTDAVWSICMTSGHRLISASSDRTISIWSTTEYEDMAMSPRLGFISTHDSIPTSLALNSQNTRQFVSAFNSRAHQLFDTETRQLVLNFECDTISHAYKVISHCTSTLVISAHEDKKIRFFDSTSGKMVHEMVAHQDACTHLALDPITHSHLLSASHDCSIRLWNLNTKNCIQEITTHRKKYDESVHCVAYHQTKSLVASGAADALIKIYV